MSKVSLVIVSHSSKLAEGVAEVAAQMAPDVVIEPAGGLSDGGIGTSFDKVDEAVSRLLEDGPVVLLTDLGSATLTVDSVLEFADGEAHFADGPLVEGAVAAAVAAQQGGSAQEVVAAVREAGAMWGAGQAESAEEVAESGEMLEAQAQITDPDGLHARPAALVARLVTDYDAEVTINGADADSVLSLMALGVRQGESVSIKASGPQASEALDALVKQLEGTPA